MTPSTETTPLPQLQPAPLLIVLSGPSGVGKDAVLKMMRQKGYPLHYSVTLTTRPRRAKERDGTDYYFTSVEEFHRMVAAGELLEWAEVYGNYYGIPRAPIREALQQGQDVLLKIDVQGAATVKKLVPAAVLIFLMPPSFEELQRRLAQRHTEFHVDLERRLSTAREEMKRLSLFDYMVVNRPEALEKAAAQVQAIITAEKCRLRPRAAKV
ncbi:MAG: guanylate kinase [Chloroflexota bacterium]